MAKIQLNDQAGRPIRVLCKYRAMALLAFSAYGASIPALAHGVVWPGQTFELALEAQTAGHYEQMLRLLRAAAQADHLAAQEMLGMALLVGPTLYGDAVKADRCEAGRWIGRALAQGSEVARFQWEFLGRVRQAPPGAGRCLSSAG